MCQIIVETVCCRLKGYESFEEFGLSEFQCTNASYCYRSIYGRQRTVYTHIKEQQTSLIYSQSLFTNNNS